MTEMPGKGNRRKESVFLAHSSRVQPAMAEKSCSYSWEAVGDDASPCLLSPSDLVQLSSSGNDVTLSEPNSDSPAQAH